MKICLLLFLMIRDPFPFYFQAPVPCIGGIAQAQGVGARSIYLTHRVDQAAPEASEKSQQNSLECCPGGRDCIAFRLMHNLHP